MNKFELFYITNLYLPSKIRFRYNLYLVMIYSVSGAILNIDNFVLCLIGILSAALIFQTLDILMDIKFDISKKEEDDDE